MVVYKREKLVFVHKPLGSWERKYRGENVILCGSIFAVGGKQAARGGARSRKGKELKKFFFGEEVAVS